MEKLLEVKDLNKSFGKTKVLHDINFDIFPNEIVGFIGPNGAGKSTVMKCILSLIFPDSGTITINGYDIKKHRIKALSSMAGVIETPGLFVDMSGEDNIKLFAELRNIDKKRVKEIMEFTKLENNLKRKAGNYSMGMKQRLALGIALLSKPKLLILDEPTNGLDPTSVIELRNVLLDLVEKEDISILFSSHQLEEVERIANRLVCINKGRIIEFNESDLKTSIYILETEVLEKLKNYLSLKAINYKDIDHKRIEVITEKLEIQSFLVDLDQAGIKITNLYKKEISLEERYKDIYMNE
ncbi:ABC transporter ATP-binding protein [Clostridium sp. MSJ-4]|uniref:ABC transporter ATP-binding protein n=1 Tax=Clostridium simiarum TaxID=2841506 RepID=A0ABS6EWV6_9CLOT|nr:ABC transporter ATP-binding protein [Clostridium simiarum]MBU5590706.1 ABC transporter ATP-binding protein [Clostridium simiarum]